MEEAMNVMMVLVLLGQVLERKPHRYFQVEKRFQESILQNEFLLSSYPP